MPLRPVDGGAPAWVHGEPAGGAPIEDLIPATIVAVVALAALGALAVAHRRGKIRAITEAAAMAERFTGLPGWVALPAALTAGALVVAVFGFYWDVATHIDSGRDAGPFANTSHFYIIAGLAGIFLAGAVSVLLGSPPTQTSVRLQEDWHAPIGGVLLLLCGGVSVLGFPLDDIWHRLFGQDVTLWSPTHIQMVGGAALSTLALWILLVEGDRYAGDQHHRRAPARVAEPLTAGAFLIGLSAMQAEFDYGVPQFRLLYHPVLLMLSAGIALVPARIRLGRWGALKALAVFLIVRVLLTAVIGPVMGHTFLNVPLYIAEALAVEATALFISPARRLSFGMAAGAAIGTFGLAAEWAWSFVGAAIAWPASLLPEGAAFGFAAALIGGIIGGYIGRALTAPAERRRSEASWLVVAAVSGLVVLLAYPMVTSPPVDATATLRLQQTARHSGRWARVAVELSPEDAARGAQWFNVTAWQGGGSIVEPLRPVGGGTYLSAEPVPVHAEWKALVRLHKGRSLSAVPIYLPQDEAIPAPGVPAEDGVTREFVPDKKLLLREAKPVSAALTYTASAALAVIVVLWVAALAWGLRRLDAAGSRRLVTVR